MAEQVFPEIQKLAAPLRQQVLDGLRRAIVSGQLAPGRRLTEPELIARMGVSRTVIREALRQLESEGLIALIPNKGPVVREVSVAEARELYAIRAVLEGLAARLFVKNADDAKRRQLLGAFDGVVSAYESGDGELMLATKIRFYDLLYEGAGSKALGLMLASLYARIWRWRVLGHRHPGRTSDRSRESIRNLKAMVAAIRKRDADGAERIARDEAGKAANEVMRLLETPEQER